MAVCAPLGWALAALVAVPGRAPVVDPELAAGLVRTAHAAVRTGRASDARPAYLEAARLLPEVGDWLLLRAAEASPDSVERRELYAQLRLAPARRRITAVEAEARERSGDWTGAAVRYDSLGRAADAWRVRLRGLAGAERQAARLRLGQLVAREQDPTRAGALSDAFLQGFPTPTAAEALLLARAATLARQHARAATYYPIAAQAGLTVAADRLAYAGALADLGRHREAISAFGRVGGPPALAAEARLRGARARLKVGDPAGAAAALWALVERYPGEREPVAAALMLLGDLARDRGEAAEARRIWLDLARQHPASAPAPRARFLAALVAYERGDPAAAAREWERLRADAAGTETGAAAGFWAGRAWSRTGEPDRARAMWTTVVQRDTLSYYAVASARRLGAAGWTPPAAADRFREEPALDSALARIAVLRRIDMSRESGWEREALVAAAAGDAERLLAVADGFRRVGEHATAIRIARQSLPAGAPGDARTYRLLYPLGHTDELRRLAADAGVEHGLLAALIRQESGWEPRATSRAGARGLMQVMPATGSQLARRLGLLEWHAERLYEPETNLRLGTAFFADVLRRYEGDPVRALAAYNAGPGRVAKWSTRAPPEDPELFVERIPFLETRDYVRLVLRNLALYRALYDAA